MYWRLFAECETLQLRDGLWVGGGNDLNLNRLPVYFAGDHASRCRYGQYFGSASQANLAADRDRVEFW